MTEDALFYGYRNATGYRAECACGDAITSKLGTEEAVASAVRIHNASPLHQQWSEWQEGVHAMQRPTRRTCPCHFHGAA